MMALKLLIFAALIIQCICEPCPNNTYRYMNTVNNASECKPCSTTCSEKSMVIIKQCTATTDSDCGCPAGQHFNKGLLFCMDCDYCQKGYGAEVQCCTESNTICKACIPAKTFSSKETMFQQCNNCTICSTGFAVKHECNATRDTICERIVYNTTQKTITREPISTVVSTTNKSKLHINPTKRKEFLIPVLIVCVFLIVVLGGICCIFIYCRRRRGVEQPINGDLECEEVIQLEAKQPSFSARHSGLRGRHTRQLRRTVDRKSSRKPLDSDGSTESLQQLPNSDKLLRDVPFDIIEKLALRLNPRGLNNWVRLAGHLKYSKEKVDYFGMEAENATQRLLSDWQTSNSSTIGALHHHLKNIDRDDAAEILETVA